MGMPWLCCLAAVASLCIFLPAHADVEEIKVNVKGITCPVCTHTINIALRGLPGVKTVRMSLATRVTVSVTPYPGVWIDPARIFRTISLVGFTPQQDEMKLKLVGSVSKVGNDSILTLSNVAGSRTQFILNLPANGNESTNKSLRQTARVLDAADKWHALAVEVEGWWRPPAIVGQLPSILITDASALAEPPTR